MAWIESHQSLRDHPKVRKAARTLGISKVAMIGHLHCLWWWALDYAQDGDLSSFTSEDIALGAEWDGDEQKFVTALIDCKQGDRPGLLEQTADGRLLLHDWWEYAGKLVERREQDAKRKRDARTKPVRGTSGGHPQDGAQTAYVPNPTQPTEPTTPNPAGFEPCLSLIAWTKTRYLQELGPGDGELVGEWVDLYGDNATKEVIEYCDAHKHTKILQAAYVAKTLSGRQMSGTLNGNGHKGEPVTIVLPNGQITEAHT